jgi:hypothetical protein
MDLINSAISQYIRVPKISVGNVQTRVGASDFSGTVSFYTSNNGCSGQPSANEIFSPSSNPLNCLDMADGDPIQSVNVLQSDDSSAGYTIYFYSDAACTDQVWDVDVNDGTQCNDPQGNTVMSVYVIQGTYNA